MEKGQELQPEAFLDLGLTGVWYKERDTVPCIL